MEQSVQPFDLQRLLIGDHPILFNLEIILRTVVIYAYTLLLLRWLGSRTIGQLSTVEFLLVIALGSAVGDGMFYADVPLLHSLVVVTIVVLANKSLDILIARSKRAERLIDGTPEELVTDGILAEKVRHGKTIGQSELFQQLRRSGIRQLGEVRYAFAEPDGEVNVFRRRVPLPGLPIVPPWGLKSPEIWPTGALPKTPLALACMRCGKVIEGLPEMPLPKCPVCTHEKWTQAARPDEADQIDTEETKRP